MRRREPEAIGAQPHLRHRLLAGNIDGAPAGPRQRRAGLDQQGRFADAGFAAHQQDRARHESATRDTVDLAEAGDDARHVGGRALQRLEGEDAAARSGAAGAAAGPGRDLLDDRVPFAAGIAAALPAVRDRAAVLADEDGAGFCHARV